MKIFARIMFLLVMALSSLTQAEPVQLVHEGLRLNADYQPGDADKPLIVILHATWQHHSNELPSYLQELVGFEGYGSLAVSLSLGLDDRQAAINCDDTPTVLGTHQQAVSELKLWFDWLNAQGHKRYILVGHSRGGAQVALYWQTYEPASIERLILIAPATYDYAHSAQSYESNFRVSLDDQLATMRAKTDATTLVTDVALLYCFYTHTSAETFISYYAEEPQKHTPALIKNITLPTTVYLGSNDNLSYQFAEYEAEFVENDQIRLVWIDGADHFFRDLYADEIVEDMLYGAP